MVVQDGVRDLSRANSCEGTLMKQPWMWFVLIGIRITLEFLAPQPALSIEESKPAPTPSTSTESKPASTPSSPVIANEGDREKEAEEVKRLQEFFLRNQSVFIRRGEVIAEFNNFYSTDQRTAFLQLGPGTATVTQTTRRFFESSIFGRLGVSTGLELDVVVPYLVKADQTTNVGTGNASTSSTGIGDVAAALRYQAWYEKGIRPSVIFDVNGKSRTAGSTLRGTNNYWYGGGVTLLKSLDPVYFFGRIGYTVTLPNGGQNLGSIWDYSIGMGFSLNDRVAFNMQYVGSLVGQTQINGVSLDDSSLEIGSLIFSATILITKKLFIEPTVGIGMTKDAFDSTVGLRIPYRF
jgi:hypothetical protein